MSMIPECNKEGLELLECFYLVIFRLRRHHMFDVASVGMDQHRELQATINPDEGDGTMHSRRS
ncbi:hypothetical protein F9C07_8136 [Aspergillus flavus]|uniref:Uncharacterized protein n=1 Tax=Aspergillus flavus (strain ATCC 200026 / FGSC A1120 / IAM 13836 / NRRL 3357 / JCM 12722 / SRRC 167) TaxID=332952 RepID=A0A7U2R2H1_ASPFN|nr:hypothetical protein F9C07_8136 [Aspergillus flavus]